MTLAEATSTVGRSLTGYRFKTLAGLKGLLSIILPHYHWRLLVQFGLPLSTEIAVKQKQLPFTSDTVIILVLQFSFMAIFFYAPFLPNCFNVKSAFM